MAIWDYIAQYNPTGFYEDNRSKTLKNDYMDVKISAANRENEREKKIMDLQDAWANGDSEALRQLGIYSPETTKKYVENADEMLSIARPMAESVLRVAPENRAKAYQQMLQGLRNKNVDVSDMPMEYDEEMITTLANSDPTKIRDERLNEQAEQRAQNAFNRSLAQLQYQNALSTQKAEAERQRRLDYLDSIKEQMTPEQYAATKSSIMGVDYTPMTPAEVALNDYLQTGNPDALAVIQRQGEAAKLLSTKNTSDSANIQANNKYEAWESENPDATEADKRNARFQYGIPNADDKAWLEQKKQQAKEGMDFLLNEGYADTPEEASNLMGVEQDKSIIGQAVSDELKEIYKNPLMKDKTYRKETLKKRAEADFKREQKIVKYNENKAKIMPLLVEALNAARDGTGIGAISGRVTKNIFASKKAADNATALSNLDNAMSPAFISNLTDAGGSSRTIDANKEMEKYIPMLNASTPPQVLEGVIKGIARNLFNEDIDKYVNQSFGDKPTEEASNFQQLSTPNTTETVIDFTEYFKGE